MFGGGQLTTTDIAVAAGRLQLGNRGRVSTLDAVTCQRVLGDCQRMVEETVVALRQKRVMCLWWLSAAARSWFRIV